MSTEPRLSMSLFRKILLSLMVVGGIASTISAGTYASFNATAQNASSTFATGSLVLSRQIPNAAACFSTSGGSTTDSNVNPAGTGCSTMLNLTRVKLGESTSVDLTISNAGSLPGNVAYHASTACSTDKNLDTSWLQGTGEICTSALLTIQEYGESARTTLGRCVFPASASPCSGLSATLKTPNLLPAAPTTLTVPAIAGGTSRYFVVSMSLPNTVSDQFQGRKATFALTWSLS